MKTLLTILFIVFALYGQSQPLMLSCSKTIIKHEMKKYSAYKKVPTDALQLEYQKDSITVVYHFTKEFLVKRCIAASITMSIFDEAEFIDSKTECNCWLSIDDNSWLYNTHLFDSYVIVKRIYNGPKVTFKYAFDP